MACSTMTTSTNLLTPFLFQKTKQSFWRGRRGAASARASVRAAWIEAYGLRCEKEAEAAGRSGGKRAPPLVAGVAFFANPADAADAAALSGACAALVADSMAALSALSPSAGASLCAKAAEALWQHRGGAAVSAELAAPRGSFRSGGGASRSTSPLQPFATPLAEAAMRLADPSFWLDRLPLPPSQEAADAAAAAVLDASAAFKKGRLLARAATLLPPLVETTTAAAASVPPSLAAALVSNLAVRCVALGPKNDSESLSALLCTPSLWLRAPPLAPLAPRLCRAAALSVAAAVGRGGDAAPPAGSPAAAAALSSWLTPLLREEEKGGKGPNRRQRWSVPGGLGAASAALAANLASSAGRAVSLSSSSASDKATAAAALCRALACLLRASPPEALGEKREKRSGSVSGYFDDAGEEEEEEDGETTSEDEEGGEGNGNGAAPMETSSTAAAAAAPPAALPSSSPSSSPHLPLDFASFDPRALPPAGLSSLTDAAGFLSPLCAAALPAATAAGAAEQQASDLSAAWLLCDALLAVMALPSRRLATLASLASAGISVVPRLWFSAARGTWRGALARAGAASAAAAGASPASVSSAAAGLLARDPRALSVLAVLSAAAATSFSTAAPDAPAAGRLLPLEELFVDASSSASASSSSSSVLPGAGLLDLSRDLAWLMLSGDASFDEAAQQQNNARPPPLPAARKRGQPPGSSRSGGENLNASPLAAAALEGVSSLLRILHDRNGMAPFAPEGAFHAAPLRREEAGRGGDGSGSGRGDGDEDEEMSDREENEEFEDEQRFEDEDARNDLYFRGAGPALNQRQRGGGGARADLSPSSSAVAAARFRAALAGGGAPAARLRRLLRHAPCLVPFEERAAAFLESLALDAERAAGGAEALALGGARQQGFNQGRGGGPPQFATVRRDHVFEDALSTLGPLPASALKGRVRVSFVDAHGLQEAGVDGGGLFKEFCEALVKEAFWPREEEEEEEGENPSPRPPRPPRPPPPPPPFPSLFVETASRELAPAPGAGRDRASATRLAFLGRVLGKLLSEGVLVELPLARFFVKQLLGRQPDLGDLDSLDPALAASLAALRRARPDEIEAAGLTFVLGMERAAVVAAGGGDSAAAGSRGVERIDVELVQGGSSLPVTSSNVAEFVHRAAAAHFSAAAPAAAALRSGLESFLPRSWPRRAFSASEFAVLLGGGRGGISVEDMRRNTVYAGGYHPRHPTVLFLWEALREMTDAERASVLRFVTACGRPPLLGFSRLHPRLCVAMSGSGRGAGGSGGEGEEGRLPSAATCMNLLKLPAYGSADEVRRKLLFAAREAGGFSLS